MYANTTTSFSKLNIGATSRILTSSGSAPQWSDPITLSVGSATTSSNISVALGGSNTNHSILFTSTSGASTGIAVSSKSTIAYNPSTDILSVSGISVTSNIASTSSSTGALTVSGGVGIGGSLFAATSLAVDSGVFGLSLQRASAGSFGAIYSTGVTPSASNYSLATDGTNLNLNSTSNIYFNISNTNKFTLSTNNLSVGINVGSTSTSTGALTVTGGVGIGGSLFTSTSVPSSISGVVLNNTVISSGSWAASAITAYYGGTGLQTTFTVGDVLYANTASTWGRLSAGSAGSVLYSAGAGTTPYWGAPGSSTNSLASAGTTNQAHYIILSRSATGSGLAYSTDANLSVNPVSDTLTLGGLGISNNLFTTTATTVTLWNSTATTINAFQAGTAISLGAGTGTFTINNSNLRINSSVASTNTSTGALIVAGGVGVSGQLSFATASLGYTGVPSTPIMNFIGSGGTSPIQLSVYSDSSLSFEGYAGQLFSIDNNLTSGEIFSVNDISGLPIISASAGQTILLNSFGGFTQVGNGVLNSTSTTTGSLQVLGGLGITGNAFIGGTVNISNGTNSISTTSGSIVISGGIGITGNAFIGGTTTITNATNSISTTSGSLVIFGGLGLTGNANIGGTVRITNATNSTSIQSGSLVILGGLGLTGNAYIGGTTNITNTTNSTNSTSGALVVSGGAGIAKSLYLGSNLIFNGSMYGGTGTYAKNVGAGDVALDNGTDDTPALLYYWANNKNFGLDVFNSGSGTTKFRIVKELNESGGTELWSLDRNGIVTRTAWDVGEVIASRMYNNSDLNMSATTTINSTTYTNVATITYTPKSSSSYLWIEFDAHYDFNDGTTTDDFLSRITVGGSAIAEKNQRFIGAIGGGTRSGTIFPISGRYTNTSTSGIAITIQARYGTADDNIRIYGSSTSGYMRIQEIGR